MSQPFSSDYSVVLRSLMQQAGLPSFRSLSRAAGVSKWQVEQLRRGNATAMRLDPLLRLSQALQMSLAELLAAFSNQAEVSTSSVTDPTDSDVLLEYPLEPSAQEAELRAEISQLQQEYQRLQTRLEQERDQVQQEFQQSSLQVLESWLIQFPTAAYAAQQNPQVSATKLLPLMRPVEQLIQAWGVEAIAPVGSEVDYDPHLHQLMDGAANAGDRVKVRYTGYRQGNKLLFRAKVSPVV